jgi:transcription antitermination protein NusB
MARRRAREFALQALYRADIAGSTSGEALRGLWQGQLDGSLEGRPAEADEVDFARHLVDGVDARKDEIDPMIDAASLNWRISRMPVVDRNILRLAAFELLSMPEVPASVSINEAVELAKRFGDKDSRAFVNGILDRIAADTGRGGRKNTKK